MLQIVNLAKKTPTQQRMQKLKMSTDTKVLPDNKSTLDILMGDDTDESSNEVAETVDLLAGEQPEEVEVPTDDVEETTEEDKEEEVVEEEKEEELKLDDENELIIPAKRKEILAAYPDLFKKFPYIEKAIFREQKFTEYFSTPQEAEGALETIKEYEKHQEELFSGSPESILKTLNTENPEGFAKLVDNYLPTLQKVSPEAFGHVLNNVYKTAIAEMVRVAKSTKNEDLEGAAVIVHQFLYGNADWVPPTNFSKEDVSVNKERETIKKEREDLQRERFDEARDGITTRIENTIKSTIESNIDPKGQMSEYVKTKAISDCIENINKLIKADTRFNSTLTRLWQDAGKRNYNKDSLDQIRSVYLTRAKVDLAGVIRDVRNNALKGSRPIKAANEEVNKGKLPVGRSVSSVAAKKQTIPAGMSIKDFIRGD
jgi:hypothetical protein